MYQSLPSNSTHNLCARLFCLFLQGTVHVKSWGTSHMAKHAARYIYVSVSYSSSSSSTCLLFASIQHKVIIIYFPQAHWLTTNCVDSTIFLSQAVVYLQT